MAALNKTCLNCFFYNQNDSINKVPAACWSCPAFDNWEPKESMIDKVKSTTCSVNSPSHYTSGGIEAIDYIQAKLGDDGCVSYCLGNVLKYVSRAGKKDISAETEDLKKAQWYLNKAILISEDNQNDY